MLNLLILYMRSVYIVIDVFVVSYLVSAAAISLGLHQLLCARRGMYGAFRDCSSNVWIENFLVKPH